MNMDFDKTVSIIQLVILFGGFVLAIRQIILLSKQIKLATNQIKQQLSWQKKNVAFEYLNKYARDLRHINSSMQRKIELLKQNGKQLEIDDISELLKDTDSRTELYEITSYYEHLAIGIQEEYFDENVIKNAKKNAVITTYKLLKPYLLVRRNETNRDIGSHFEKLALKWEKEKS